MTLGIGLDLHWGRDLIADPVAGDRAGESVKAFFRGLQVDHLFVAWQARSRAQLRAEDYFAAWDDLFAAVPSHIVRGLHHTALNLAASTAPTPELLAFTNALIRRYDLRWVNEDLGFWALNGRPLPYPLPPLLTDEGLAVCVRNALVADAGLAAPLVVEFPGFSQGWSVRRGPWDAYDYFREVVDRSDTVCTLDTGHLLSWRWLLGYRGGALFDDLDRLPLDRCVEVHLSGATVRADRFYDTHDGVLIDEQLYLLDLLRERCPRLERITFEDPVLEPTGALNPGSRHSLTQLEVALAA